MAGRARVREMMMGVEGLALMRTALDGDQEFVDARVAEMLRIADPDGPFARPPRDLDELGAAEGYAAWAATYDSLPNFILAVEEPVVDGLLARLAPGVAVDAACGTGRHSSRLVAHGHTVVGVDQSREMLDVAAAKVPGAEFRVGDLTGLPLPDGSADLVLCGLALSHLPDVEPAVAEFRRVLRPGGRLIVTDVHPMMILLQGQPIFARGPGRLAFVRVHPHQLSDHLRAFAAHGFAFRSSHEPTFAGPLPPGGHEERIAEAANAAWAGIPSAVVWELESTG